MLFIIISMLWKTIITGPHSFICEHAFGKPVSVFLRLFWFMIITGATVVVVGWDVSPVRTRIRLQQCLTA